MEMLFNITEMILIFVVLQGHVPRFVIRKSQLSMYEEKSRILREESVAVADLIQQRLPAPPSYDDMLVYRSTEGSLISKDTADSTSKVRFASTPQIQQLLSPSLMCNCKMVVSSIIYFTK